MADILVTDVVYTEQGIPRKTGGTKSQMTREVDLVFGDAAKLYRTATGVPLSVPKLGFPVRLSVLKVVGRTITAAGTNYVWEWNKSETAPALVGFEVRTGQAGPEGLTQVADSTAIVTQTIRVYVEGA